MKETSRKKLKEDATNPDSAVGGYGGQLTTTCGVAWILVVNLFHHSFPSTKVPISNGLCCLLRQKKKNNQKKKWNKLVLCYCRVQFCDIDLTLLPSLGEVGECHELLNSVWQSMNPWTAPSPFYLPLPSTRGRVYSCILQHGQGRKRFVSQKIGWPPPIQGRNQQRLTS